MCFISNRRSISQDGRQDCAPPSRCSNQGLTGEPHTSFPNAFRSRVRWTSKGHSAGRLRWTSNRAKLPFTESNAESGDWSGILIYKDRKSGQEAGLRAIQKVILSICVPYLCRTRVIRKQMEKMQSEFGFFTKPVVSRETHDEFPSSSDPRSH